ncbi:hypothetical protein [Streptococcus cuniculi]|uniref:DUF5648 domain-containing protein n=1 Tax=Streptococcus cuniculi TaxID=1432788 RepID=A0A4Y9J784_9STRE|nr:hypothetical protein [Streptococcus cuniculi]MBF0779314.1 hypothetical protein [Streptococcus cuniculi]TFU96692.1 hypothetical protein E4T82_11465 [Streptococcus cuniculi]
MKVRNVILSLVGMLSLVLLFAVNTTSIYADEKTYDYESSEKYFDFNTIPAEDLVVGDSGQVRPNQNSIFKDFEYAFSYHVSDPTILSIDKKGNWKVLKSGKVTLMVFGRHEYNESPEFEAELDKYGIVRKFSEGPRHTKAPFNVYREITVTDQPQNIGVYRLYNPNLKVHLYTKDINEYTVLAARGWRQEGVAWQSHLTKGTPVYRLYHSGLKVHLYTMDTNEYKILATRGWNQEGEAYKSNGSTPVYRLYHAGIKKHLYTRDANEKNVLSTRGWKYEGVAWNVE